MRSWVPLAAVVLAVVLTSCSTPAVVETGEPTAKPSSAPTEPPSAKPEPSADAAGEVPQACIDYDASATADTGPLAAAATAAALPAGMVLNPGLQVVESVDDPGMSEVVARVCSAGADRAALVEAGNAIASAIDADPAGESVTTLSVSAWVPSGQYLDRDPAVDSITTDFELYLWDAEPGRLESNWR